MPKTETQTQTQNEVRNHVIAAQTVDISVEKRDFKVQIPEVTLTEAQVLELAKAYIQYVASSMARYEALKLAKTAEEVETEVKRHCEMAKALLNRDLTESEVHNVEAKVRETKNFKGNNIVSLDLKALKRRLEL